MRKIKIPKSINKKDEKELMKHFPDIFSTEAIKRIKQIDKEKKDESK